MIKLGFPSNWVALIMRCVTFVSFSVLINGVPAGKRLAIGLPLSPYLFILCAEALSNLLILA